MKLLCLDLETTSLDTQTAEVTELGYALYDTDLAGDTPVLMKDFLTIPKTDITEEITDITGITNELLQMYGVPVEAAFLELVNDLNKYQPDAIVGHNLLGYDLPIVVRHLDLLKPHAVVECDPIQIDTRIDLPHKRAPKNNSLIFLSADVAKFCNPFSHRAMFDVLSTMKLLFSFELIKVLESASTPLVTMVAGVTFHTKDLAKNRGFGYNPDTKEWTKTVRESQLFVEKQKAMFDIHIKSTTQKLKL